MDERKVICISIFFNIFRVFTSCALMNTYAIIFIMLLREKEKKSALHWFVYILRCADSTLYCGITKNIEQRLEMHNGIRQGGAKYTRGRGPVELVIYTQVVTQGEALLLEKRIKKLPKKQKVPFVQNINNCE